MVQPLSALSWKPPLLARVSIGRAPWAAIRPVWRRLIEVLILGYLLLGLLAGCGSSGPTQRDQFYTLQPEAQIKPSAETVPGSLLITPLASRGFLGGTQILFRTASAPLQVQRYDHFFWDPAPGRAIAETLIDTVRSGGIFQHVISVADRAQADFMLNGVLTRLEHLPTADPPQVIGAFNLTLIASHNRSIQFSQSYSSREPTSVSTPEEMARAFNRLIGRLLSQAVDDIQRSAPRLQDVSASGD